MKNILTRLIFSGLILFLSQSYALADKINTNGYIQTNGLVFSCSSTNLSTGGNLFCGGFGPLESAGGFQPSPSVTESVYLGDRSGALGIAASFQTCTGHNCYGIGSAGTGCSITVAGNNTGDGTDVMRNICNGTGNTIVGSFGLKFQAGQGNGVNDVSGLGSNIFTNLNSNAGTVYDTGIGADGCPGLAGSANFKFVTCIGGLTGANLTTAQNVLLLGFHTGNTTLQSGQAVILVGSGNVQIDTPAAGTSNYINFENEWIVTGTGTVGTSVNTHRGQIVLPDVASATGAQTGTLCWVAAGITFDPSLGCLTSSSRFKTNWNQVTGNADLNIVMSLNPGTFKKKPEFGGKEDPTEQFGFLAEEVAKTDDRLVAFEPDGTTPRGVRYPQMTAVITGAVQELEHRIERQQIEIWILTGWLAILSGVIIFPVVRNRYGRK